MSTLAAAVTEYLEVRRSLGFKLARTEKLLAQFVEYCSQLGAATVSSEIAVAWAKLPIDGNAAWWSHRLGVVRMFASWLQAQDPSCELPPTDVFGPLPNRRALPYLYTEAEVVALMDATNRLRYPLERASYRSLVGLLAVSGMRIGEVISLDRKDVDFEQALLTVWSSKFGKSRIVPLHSSSVKALIAYSSLRDELCPRPKSPSFFVSSAGTRLIYCNVSSLFRKLVRLAGLAPRSHRCRPRIHDYADLRVMPTLGLKAA
jgi:integrase